MKMTTNYLSDRGRSFVKKMPPLMEAHFKIIDKLYNPVHRPDGYINMGTAENHLADAYMIPLLERIQKEMPVTSKQLHYDFSYGTRTLREAIANYYQKNVFSSDAPALSAENVIVSAGCSVILEFLSIMLGNRGDLFLVPTPFYSGFLDDMGGRAGVGIRGVNAGPHLDVKAFEAALQEETLLGKKVVGILLSSPNNPVGTLYSAEEIKDLINFAVSHKLELVSDELYAQTVHSPSAKFVSAYDVAPKKYINHIHVTGSFSKDFALSGFRTGFLFSFNSELLKGMQTLSYYANVSNHTQAMLAELLKIKELPQTLAKIRKVLQRNCQYMKESLETIGVKSSPVQSGFFLFSDFNPFMQKEGYEGELALWDTFMNELKINITPGFVFQTPAPGFFRICCAHPVEEINEACRRFSLLKR